MVTSPFWSYIWTFWRGFQTFYMHSFSPPFCLATCSTHRSFINVTILSILCYMLKSQSSLLCNVLNCLRTRVYPKVSGLTDCLERELQMVQLSTTRCSCIAILWGSLVSSAAITLCVASQRVFIVVVYFFMTQSGNFWIHPRISFLLRPNCLPVYFVFTCSSLIA
jgi:hypothetical protein